MRPSGKETTDNRIRLFEALIYLAATAATIYLTVEEWRIQQAIAEIRTRLRLYPPSALLRGNTEPTPVEISDLHREIRSITEETKPE